MRPTTAPTTTGMGGTVLLYNDSPFILTATVQASDGSFLGQYSIQPGQQKNFTTNLSTIPYETPGAPDVSLTPYSVIWQCPSEGYYSMCTIVSPGCLVRANGCPGNRFCQAKQPPPEQKPASTLRKAPGV